MKKNIFTFDDLVTSDHKPRLHGNGFIQLDIIDNFRLHVWPEVQLQAQDTYTPWHDHTFGFISHILCGYLIHTHYKILPNDLLGNYNLYEAVPELGSSNTKLIQTPGRFDLVQRNRDVRKRGGYYNFPAGEFHTSEGIGLTATLMEKTTQADSSLRSRVLCWGGNIPDNSFDRHSIKESVLWNEIRKVFDKIDYLTILTKK